MRNIVVSLPEQQEAHSSWPCSPSSLVAPERSTGSHTEQRRRSESSSDAASRGREARRVDSAIELPEVSKQTGDRWPDQAGSSNAAGKSADGTCDPVSSNRQDQSVETMCQSGRAGHGATSVKEALSLPEVAAEQGGHHAETSGADTVLETRGPASQLSFRGAGAAPGGDSEAAAILASRTHGLTFVMARFVLKARQRSHWARRLLIENLYGALRSLSYDANESWCAVHERVLDVRITYHV